MPEIEGRVNHVVFFNQDNMFTIARLETEEGVVAVLGNLGRLNTGENLRLVGDWEIHPRFGRQFKVQTFEVVLPASVAGIRDYLASGVVKGIGPAMADKIVDAFGENTLEVLDDTPEKLLEIRGIGQSKLDVILKEWKAKRIHRDTMVFLAGHGIGPGHSARILAAYGEKTLEVLQSNPFRLALDIQGIGFATADSIGKKLGMEPDSTQRLEAGILHLLGQAAGQGHFFVPEKDLVEQAGRMLEAELAALESTMARLEAQDRVVLETLEDEPGANVYLPAFWAAEVGLARRLAAFLSVPVSEEPADAEKIHEHIHHQLAIELSQGQLNVLHGVMGCRMAVITGGPGTGKTTLVRSIQLLLEARGMGLKLAAPTGRAAKRLSEVTGKEAVTIHRLLGYDFVNDEFTRNEQKPLESDAVIIDEASMVDAFLMYHLQKAVPMGARLILVGDVNQLPPVGPGNALKDIIASGRVPVFELTEIYRQAAQSDIVQNAHRVNTGMNILPGPRSEEEKTDFYVISEDKPEKMVQTVVTLCKERIPAVFGMDPMNDIQVLTPMHKGPAGTRNLNAELQKVLNPGTPSIDRMGQTYGQGDKVMQIRNNYSKEVYNGDIGTIRSLDKDEGRLIVDFDTGPVGYDFSELDELILAYAISVHKSQGSEYPVVVLLLSTSHYVMLQRNLLYTGITRAKELLVLVGGPKALSIAIGNNRPSLRRTRLAARLSQPQDLPQ